MLKTYLRETELFPFSQDTNQEEMHIKKGVTLLVAMQDSYISRSQNSRSFKEIQGGDFAFLPYGFVYFQTTAFGFRHVFHNFSHFTFSQADPLLMSTPLYHWWVL